MVYTLSREMMMRDDDEMSVLFATYIPVSCPSPLSLLNQQSNKGSIRKDRKWRGRKESGVVVEDRFSIVFLGSFTTPASINDSHRHP